MINPAVQGPVYDVDSNQVEIVKVAPWATVKTGHGNPILGVPAWLTQLAQGNPVVCIPTLTFVSAKPAYLVSGAAAPLGLGMEIARALALTSSGVEPAAAAGPTAASPAAINETIYK
jgi:hypothetical protein